MGTRLYIGNLSHRVRDRDVEKFLKGYGRIREVVLKNGYGFVEFDDYRDANDAVYELNGRDLMGDRVTIEHARGTPHGRDMQRDAERGIRYGGGGYGGRRRSGGERRDRFGPPVRTEHRLLVENLSSKTSWQDLKDIMRRAGEVTYADAHRLQKNDGVVEFATRADMMDALDKLDGTEINGRKIRLREDKPRSSRHRSRSSTRSRSRSRSRSRKRSRSRSSHSRSRSRSRSMSKSKSRSPSPAHDRRRSGDHSDREED